MKSGCTRKTVYRRLPFLSWLPQYSSDDCMGDIMAGITVGLTIIPQSLAYANVAGLPPQVTNTFYITSYVDGIFLVWFI